MPKKARDNAADTVLDSIVKNYDMISGAQLSNSFMILMALNESNDPLSATEISKVIASHTNGRIFKIPATLQDSIEKRLKREGYAIASNAAGKTRYAATPKGKDCYVLGESFLKGVCKLLCQHEICSVLINKDASAAWIIKRIRPGNGEYSM